MASDIIQRILEVSIHRTCNEKGGTNDDLLIIAVVVWFPRKDSSWPGLESPSAPMPVLPPYLFLQSRHKPGLGQPVHPTLRVRRVPIFDRPEDTSMRSA